MKILKPALIGFSYICLFRTAFLTEDLRILSKRLTTSVLKKNMENKPDSYKSGSSSVAFVTTPDEVAATKLAHGLISEKLAACVNIIPKIISIYEWEGKINEDKEYLMMIKTRTSRIEEVTKYVRENHPYSVAEVISLPIENGNIPYLDWISKIVPDKS